MDGELKGPVIDVRGVSVRRGPATILQDVGWRVDPGQHWVLLGANGSGKTSLLNVLAGYLTPSAGAIHVCGRTYGEFPWPELRLMLGIVSNNLSNRFQPDNTALEVVASGRAAVINPWEEPTDDEAAQARALLADARLPGLEARLWQFLSQGERQRVLICRALMPRPRLLILDEPCSGLDPVARQRFLGYVESVTQQPGGPAVVLVTHHVEEITPSITHALVLKAGRALVAGPIDAVLTAPLLSEAFGTPVEILRDGETRHLRVTGA